MRSVVSCWMEGRADAKQSVLSVVPRPTLEWAAAFHPGLRTTSYASEILGVGGRVSRDFLGHGTPEFGISKKNRNGRPVGRPDVTVADVGETR
jgi:hypothetical protein